MQYVGGMSSTPLPTPWYRVWSSYLCAVLSLYQEQGFVRPCWKGGMPGGLAQGTQVSDWLPLTPCFPYTRCLCKALRPYFNAVEGLERSKYFTKSYFPSSPLTECMKAEERLASPLQLSRPVNPITQIQRGMNHCFCECPAARRAELCWCLYSSCTCVLWKHLTCCSLSCWCWEVWVAQSPRCSLGKEQDQKRENSLLLSFLEESQVGLCCRASSVSLKTSARASLLTKSHQLLWFAFGWTWRVGSIAALAR